MFKQADQRGVCEVSNRLGADSDWSKGVETSGRITGTRMKNETQMNIKTKW